MTQMEFGATTCLKFHSHTHLFPSHPHLSYLSFSRIHSSQNRRHLGPTLFTFPIPSTLNSANFQISPPPPPPKLTHNDTNLIQYIDNTQCQPLPRSIRNRNQKFDKNVTKRGKVPIGKAAEHEDEFPVSKVLIGFFLFVVLGSSLVQFFNIFSKAPVVGP